MYIHDEQQKCDENDQLFFPLFPTPPLLSRTYVEMIPYLTSLMMNLGYGNRYVLYLDEVIDLH